MSRVRFTEARKDLAEMLNQVPYQGARVVVQPRCKDVGALVSMEDFAILERVEDAMDAEADQDAPEDLENAKPIPWSVARSSLTKRDEWAVTARACENLGRLVVVCRV